MELDDLQQELESRFEQLCGERAEDRRIFALEHGLPLDLEELAAQLSRELKCGNPRQVHWLVWVVFAAEVGYSFAGGEYWQTFGERLPAWRESADGNRNRSQIRVWFRLFANKYNGVRPSGTWARQFSIISWPITHAILPKDLQFQFAKSLYHNRFKLAAENDSAVFGRLIHTQALPTSSRFREFSEQEELAGRIALALLRADSEESPLSPEVTKRIIDDLQATQSAKEWLQKAREIRRIRGARKEHQAENLPAEIRQQAEARLNLKPTLLLSRVGTDWKVGVLIPSFAPIAAAEASVGKFLRSTRVQLQGGAGSWQPGQVLLGRSKLHMLQHWPEDGAVIRFKDSNGVLEHLLSVDGTLGSGPIWVCKIGADGLARQVRDAVVRPGHAYILLARHGHVFPRSQVIEPIASQCDGVTCVRLALPKHLSGEIRQLVRSLGLGSISTVRVWPAGIPAIAWDGEGFSEWLTTDSPAFGMDVDQESSYVDVVLNSSERFTISRIGISGPTWFQLPSLPAGQHSLSIKVRHRDGGTKELASGELVLDVRDPLGLEDTINQRGGLMAAATPADAALEDLEEGRLHLELFGPVGRKTDLFIEVLGADFKQISIGSVELPGVVANLWDRVPDDAKELIGVSSSCRLIASADEIGAFILPLERTSRPVRWLPRREKQTIVLRLIDEAGLGAAAECQVAQLDHPNTASLLDYGSCVAGVKVTPPGGLYVVTGRGRIDAVVVSAPHQVRRGDIATQIGFSPMLDRYASSAIRIKEDIETLTLWSKARVVGPLGGLRRGKVLRTMRVALTGLVCGASWMRAEARFEASEQDAEAIGDLGDSVSVRQEGRSFAAKLRISYHEAASSSPADVVNWLTPIATAFGLCNDKYAVERALHYLTDPAGFVASSSNVVNEVQELAQMGELLRGTRYLQILLEGRSWDWG